MGETTTMTEDKYIRAITVLRNNMASMVEQLNDILKDQPTPVSFPHKTQTEVNEIMKNLDIAELETLEWRQGRFVKNQRAKKGEHGWIFREPREASDKTRLLIDNLTHAIVRAGGTLELGPYIFEFSGTNSQYISRKPRKMETAT